MTTSLSCDGNLNTFRYLEKKIGVPYTFLDVPYADDEASVDYLAEQLKEICVSSGGALRQKLCSGKVKRDHPHGKRDKRSAGTVFPAAEGSLVSRGTHQPPVSHDGDAPDDGYQGTAGTGGFSRGSVMQKYPAFDGKRILWVHLMPFYQETLKEYFNEDQKYQIIASDMELDGPRHLDENAPFRALAQKNHCQPVQRFLFS